MLESYFNVSRLALCWVNVVSIFKSRSGFSKHIWIVLIIIFWMGLKYSISLLYFHIYGTRKVWCKVLKHTNVCSKWENEQVYLYCSFESDYYYVFIMIKIRNLVVYKPQLLNITFTVTKSDQNVMFLRKMIIVYSCCRYSKFTFKKYEYI